jgi:hypothetical protein
MAIAIHDLELSTTIEFLDELANTLDRWADESGAGGWSTHQCEANRNEANRCRREAAKLRRIRER